MEIKVNVLLITQDNVFNYVELLKRWKYSIVVVDVASTIENSNIFSSTAPRYFRFFDTQPYPTLLEKGMSFCNGDVVVIPLDTQGILDIDAMENTLVKFFDVKDSDRKMLGCLYDSDTRHVFLNGELKLDLSKLTNEDEFIAFLKASCIKGQKSFVTTRSSEL